ncbi:MAG: InlB B-repeat-containing protein, partial [bacterium]
LTAQWTANDYTITFDSAGGSLVADITQALGSVVTAPADPTRAGYSFAGWSPAVPATMPLGGAALTAQWTASDYTITFHSDGGSPVADITQALGSAVSAPADPTRAGYSFAGWNPALPATMPLGGAALTAQWTATDYTITFNSAGGSPVADITQAFGSAVSAPADPTKAGYSFAGWNPALPATMPLGGAALTAQWTDLGAPAHTISASAGAQGSISPIGDTSVADGADQTYTITPDPGYHVEDVLVDGASVGAVTSYTFTSVIADHTISATFAANAPTQHTISASAGAQGSISPSAESNGRISPSGAVRVTHGANQTFIITPAAGYQVADVLVDGASVGAVTSYTFTNVTADHSIVAEFGHVPDVTTNRWTDISDQQWVDIYGVTAREVDVVADGYNDGTFRPSLLISRAQFTKMVVDGFGLPKLSPTAPSYEDVPITHFYHQWIEGGTKANIVIGFEDGAFRPSLNISRQHANTILGRYLSQKELASKGSIEGELGSYASVEAWYAAEGTAVLAAFADASQLYTVHAPSTAYLVYHGVVWGSSSGGNSYLTPLSNLTRAQAAVLIARMK